MKNLSLYEFKLLSDHDQYDLVFTKGEFITNREEGSSRYVLYALSRFFIEIEYDVVSNKIVGKRSFVSGKLLDKYSRNGSFKF